MNIALVIGMKNIINNKAAIVLRAFRYRFRFVLYRRCRFFLIGLIGYGTSYRRFISNRSLRTAGKHGGKYTDQQQ